MFISVYVFFGDLFFLHYQLQHQDTLLGMCYQIYKVLYIVKKNPYFTIFMCHQLKYDWYLMANQSSARAITKPSQKTRERQSVQERTSLCILYMTTALLAMAYRLRTEEGK